MTKDGKAKAERNERAMAQEERIVRTSRDPAYRVTNGKKTDVLIFHNNGVVEICDAKFTDDEVTNISKHDIRKGLNQARKFAVMGHKAKFTIDMQFPRHKKTRRITIEDECYGMSLRCWVTEKKIMTRRVVRGD